MQQGIGDLTSAAPGTAARFNAGKPRVDLLPLHVLASMMVKVPSDAPNAQADEMDCMYHLGAFQARNGDDFYNLALATCALNYPIEACADAFEYGLKKYAAWNWSKGMPWSAMIASTTRHLLAGHRGETHDKESGCEHIGMAMFGLLCLAVYIDTYPEGDDRPSNLTKNEAPK